MLPGWHGEAAAQTLKDFMKSTREAGQALFGSTEMAAANLTALPQWARVLSKMKTERKQFRACLDNPAACSSAGLKAWRDVAAATKGKPELEVLKTVNGYFNHWPYKPHRVTYGTSEFWATPQAVRKRPSRCGDPAT